MPKLPPDEKLFTPDQLAEFQNPCDSCGQPLGVHKAGTRQCPAVPPITGWRPTAFVSVETQRIIRSLPVAATFAVGARVKFGAIHSPKTGTVIEVVPVGQLPTTSGLRHIADKRRAPKPRDVVSYVVEISEADARNDLNRVIPKRDRLFWPGTFALEAV